MLVEHLVTLVSICLRSSNVDLVTEEVALHHGRGRFNLHFRLEEALDEPG